MDVRIGALAFVGLLVVAAVVAFTPASALGLDCGYWWGSGPDSAAGQAVCEGPRSTRMYWTFGLLAAAFVVPRAITFLAGTGKRQSAIS